MAEPTARSYQQILGDMVAGFLARKRIPKMKPASPVLSLLETAAQSDVRSTQDIFASLNARSIDRTGGVALDRTGLDEDTPRRSVLAANGMVTFSDSSITKISNRISPAKAAPIVGSTTIYLVDGSEFDGTGSVYLGRTTDNYEGPLAYTSVVDNGSYWTMTLSSPTQRFHQLQESVVQAQGGDRTISAGLQVTTPTGTSTTAVSFTTLYAAVIPDGEVSVEGVFVICTLPGSIGNVPQGAISVVTTPPFVGCAVTNPAGYVTGRDTETDNDYRDRIKTARATRTKGTDLTIQTVATGIASDEDSRRVVSAKIVRRENEPVTLYIDDGSGYEEVSEPISLEPLADSALGGEEHFQLSFRPVAKAYVQTLRTAPFELTEDSHLAVIVGGVTYDHYFDPTLFRAIASASAYEVVASINADSSIPLNARTALGGTAVVIFAKEDTNEDIQVTTPAEGDNANDVFGFGVLRVDTLKLYKNDQILNKDGSGAEVASNSLSSWASLSGTQTLSVGVDGTPVVSYSFTAQDFIDASTGYTAMGVNSVEAWAAVFNARLPGITATAGTDTLSLASNSERSARARVQITEGTLTTANMFEVSDVEGADADYTLNRNSGELRLTVPLVEGDSLAAGSFNTRAFLESEELTTETLASTGNLWFVVDGSAEQLAVGVNTTDTFDLTNTFSGAWGERWTLHADTGTPFENVEAGDWMIAWDTAVAAGLRGVWRVAIVTDAGATVQFDTPVTGIADSLNFTFAASNIRFVRTTAQPQNIQIPAAANYTAQAFSTLIDSLLVGGSTSVYRTTKLRVKTNTFAIGGDIALVAMDAQGSLTGLAETVEAVENLNGHLASVEAGNSEIGNTDFAIRAVTAESTTLTDIDGFNSPAVGVAWNKFVVGEKSLNDVGTTTRWGNNQAYHSLIDSLTSGATAALIVRDDSLQLWAEDDQFYLANAYSMGPNDDLTTVIDQDTTFKRFLTKMWRALTPVGAAYGLTNTFVDADNSGLSLTQAFNLDYDFDDFVVYMHARVLTHSADATKRILWRWKRLGADGNQARIRYVNPIAASTALSVDVDNTPAATAGFPTANAFNLISVMLPSDVVKTGYALRSSTRIGYGASPTPSVIDGITIAVGFTIASATRAANVTTLTLTLPSGLYAVTDHNLQIGDSIFVTSTSGSFTSGLYVLTARAATTVSYAEVAANAGPIASIGTISTDTALTGFGSAVPTPIAIGDIIRFEDSTSLPADLRNRSMRIGAIGAQFIQAYSDYDYAGAQNTLLTWATLTDHTQVKFFSILAASATATAIAAAVNALDDTCPITATVTGTGAGTVLLTSREEVPSENPLLEYLQFADGINWVSVTTSPGSMAGNYDLTFKAPITAGLVSNTDWANEEIRIVPQTAADIVQWLNTPAISGLFAVANVVTSSRGQKPQIASLTPGTDGSVQVQGGLANSSTASVVGAGEADDSGTPVYSSVSVLSADADGFTAGHWVSLDNADRLAKSGLITSTTAVTSIAADGTVILSAGPAVYTQRAAASASTGVEIRREGRYMVYIGIASAFAFEGDWLEIRSSGANPLSSQNIGIFRVVRMGLNEVYIENANGVEESDVSLTKHYLSAGSMMPGDTISISSSAWGANNQGVWTVESVGDNGTPFSSTTRFKIDVSDNAMTAGGPFSALGATEADLFVVTEAEPLRAIKKIFAIAPNIDDETLVDVKFSTGIHFASFNESVGTVMSSLDKLAFDDTIVPGMDGYRYGTGLVGEVNRVIYGDPRDSATYPGVAAAGAKINIAGPLPRRVTVSLAIRIRLGVIPVDVINRVRAVVAAVINGAGIGKPIAISSLVSAAAGVTGVVAVSVISPSYSSGSDLISIQPYEKPLILDADEDISVSIVGE